MKIITLDECGSTNNVLKEMLARPEWLPSGTTVRAIKQTEGRGQRGNSWEAEPGMNLTFSMVLRPGAMPPDCHFLVSEAIAVALVKFIQMLPGMENHEVRIKWPNDILVDGKKIAGVLIENSLGGEGALIYSIAGIGLNVNQTLFTSNAPNAVSLSQLTGEYYDLEFLLPDLTNLILLLVNQLAPELAISQNNGDKRIHTSIETVYHNLLWRANGFHEWEDASTHDRFLAELVSVAPSGQMILSEADGRLHRYYFKEVVPV